MATVTDLDGHLRLYLTSAVSGTTASWYWELWSEAWGYASSATVFWTGSVAGSTPVTLSSSTGQTKLLASGTITKSGARGATYTVGVSVSGAYDGSAPVVSLPITIPALPPAAPVLAVSNRTSSSARVTWSAPANNGAAITGYEWQVDTTSAFSSPDQSGTIGGSPLDLTGLARATSQWVRVRAVNTAGPGAWGTVSFTTLAEVPTGQPAPTASNVGPDSADLAWGVPADSGGATVTQYRVKYATNAAMTAGLVTLAPQTTRTATLTGLSPGTDYWATVQAYNSAGWSADSPATPLSTLSPVYFSAAEGGPAEQVQGYLAEGSGVTKVRLRAPDGAGWAG